jgi:large subunit ribosomal protein L4
MAVRNVPYVEVTEVDGIDPVSLVKFNHVVITEAALKEVEGWLS